DHEAGRITPFDQEPAGIGSRCAGVRRNCSPNRPRLFGAMLADPLPNRYHAPRRVKGFLAWDGICHMTDSRALPEALHAVQQPLWLRVEGERLVPVGPVMPSLREGERLVFVPPCRPEDLGDHSFRADHRLRYPYVTGAMANGIGSADLVEAMGRVGMLG